MNDISQLTDFEDIVSLLKECDEAYFNGDNPIISDRDYDLLKRRAFGMEPSNEYFVKIGSDVRGGKTKLPYPMGSLNQIYDGESQHWASKYMKPDDHTIITEKLDGVSVLLIYNNGNLSIAYSRGNGLEGADVTRHVKSMKSLPLSIDADYVAIRAEIIMSNQTFSEKYSEDFKNPRNMVAGVMNRKENERDLLENLDVVAYEIIAHNLSNKYFVNTKEDSLNTLRTLGFRVANFIKVKSSELTDALLVQTLNSFRASSDYELDGLVVTVNDLNNLHKQSASSSLNPEHSVKFKTVDEASIVETLVKQVHWEISKSGYIKPRVEVFPVSLFGTSVKFATGFNYKFINDNGIGPGAKVKITKAGMTIPYLVSVVTPSITTSLPSATLGAWKVNATGVEAVMEDLEHPSVVFKQVLDFFETYKIDLLREATLTQIWNNLGCTSYDEAICDICDLTESEWVAIIGINGSRVYSSIRNRLGNSTKETFYGACRYMGIGFGVRKAKALLGGLTVPLESLSLEDIVERDGFDVKTASVIVAGLPKALSLRDKLLKAGVLSFIQQNVTTELKNLNVVMTGFRDADLQNTIESMGGKVGSGVSKKTTHLLCMDANSSSSKMQKAREMGVKIMTPDE